MGSRSQPVLGLSFHFTAEAFLPDRIQITSYHSKACSFGKVRYGKLPCDTTILIIITLSGTQIYYTFMHPPKTATSPERSDNQMETSDRVLEERVLKVRRKRRKNSSPGVSPVLETAKDNNNTNTKE